MKMEKTNFLKRHATIDLYLYDGQLEKREVLTNPEIISMNNMHNMPLLDFDLSYLAGKKILSASLEMTNINGDVPFEVDITTISQNWNEKYATYYAYDKGRTWAFGGWFSDVIMSAGYSKYFREKVVFDEKTKAVTVNIPAEVIYAMAVEQSFGFGILDAKSYGYPDDKPDGNGGKRMKLFAAVPELGPVPKLTVEYEDADCVCAPVEVKNLSALPVEARDSDFGMAVNLNWDLEGEICDNMYYNIYYSDSTTKIKDMKLLEKYMTPSLDKKSCGTTVCGLEADKKYWFAVGTSNGISKSVPVVIGVSTLTAEKMPEVIKSETMSKECAKDAFVSESFTVGIIDETAKINPVSGEAYVYGETSPWISGIYADKKVYISCAKGEKYAFQLAVTTKKEQADFDIDLCGCLADSVKLYKVWCVNTKDNWYPEIAIPIAIDEGDNKFAIPYVDNKIAGQKELSILVEIDISEYAKAKIYDLKICVKSGNEQIVIPVNVEVADIVVPRVEDKFVMELNGYVYLPKCAGYELDDPRCKDVEREYNRLAYEHNSVINILPYSHGGIIQENAFAPEIGMVDGDMRVTNWSAWDDHFEQYINGSYVEEITEKRVPVTHLYLPFHENWPMKVSDYYKIKVNTTQYPHCVNEHMEKCTNIYDDFDEGYRRGIKSVMKDFIRHFEEKGWHNVQFQYFFNNKHFYKQKGIHDNFPFGDGLAKWLAWNTTPNDGSATSWWLLDEPHYRTDWEALEFYASILREAQKETKGGKMIKFRADLSCFNHAWNFLDGLLDTNAAGGTIARYREDILRKRKRVFGEEYWPYGGWRGISDDNTDAILWIIDIYLRGSRGVLPWYNFALDLNYETADNCAAIYPAKRFGKDTAYASMRLKAGRKGLEIVKYLEALRKAFGYSDKQLRHYVSAFVNLTGENVKKDAIDAGTNVYAKSQNSLEEMKRDMLKKLDTRKSAK